MCILLRDAALSIHNGWGMWLPSINRQIKNKMDHTVTWPECPVVGRAQPDGPTQCVREFPFPGVCVLRCVWCVYVCVWGAGYYIVKGRYAEPIPTRRIPMPHLAGRIKSGKTVKVIDRSTLFPCLMGRWPSTPDLSPTCVGLARSAQARQCPDVSNALTTIFWTIIEAKVSYFRPFRPTGESTSIIARWWRHVHLWLESIARFPWRRV